MPVSIVCSVCGDVFQKPPSTAKTRKYCSKKCYNRGIKRGDTRKGVTIVCKICGNSFYVRRSRANTAKYCCYRCHQIGEGRKGGRVIGLRMTAEAKGKSYPKRLGSHYHRQVAELAMGRPLAEGEIVHHKDGNKLNNVPENLEVMTQSEHMKRHLPAMLAKRREKHGY